MKLNSHLIGLGIGAVAIVAWMFFTDKEVETFLDWKIFKSGSLFKVEYQRNTRNQNPTFKTLAEAKVWISAKVTMSKLKSAIPWGSQ